MSKSLGNFFTVRDVLKYYDAETIRYFLMSGHYRSQLNYSEENLKQARSALERLYTALRGTDKSVDAAGGEAFEARFIEAMDDDFNTPEAYSVLFDMAREVNRLKTEDAAAANAMAAHLRKLAAVLGLLEQEPEAFLQSGAQVDDAEVAEIESLIQQRLDARKAKELGGGGCGARPSQRDGHCAGRWPAGHHLAPEVSHKKTPAKAGVFIFVVRP
ncbi:cysteinyl-tRNA synthetase [Klebsiella pneumoniae]|uniref:Cysteine--tRNA ligase n=1 Tax=Klebsiella pneumoniae TaxID=573 RepID=A0A378F655_KLEPN|nr:cysteinyl-tRNA synthetase [Klebsiella pneumoniae]